MEAVKSTFRQPTLDLVECLNETRALRKKTAEAVQAYLSKGNPDPTKIESNWFLTFFTEKSLFDDLEKSIKERINESVKADIEDSEGITNSESI